MTLTQLGYGLSWVICLGIIVVGARFLLAPRPSAAGFGVDVGPDAGRAGAYLAVKAVRDIGSGLVAFVLIVAASRQALGLFMLAAASIPIGDALVVLRYKRAQDPRLRDARRHRRGDAGHCGAATEVTASRLAHGQERQPARAAHEIWRLERGLDRADRNHQRPADGGPAILIPAS